MVASGSLPAIWPLPRKTEMAKRNAYTNDETFDNSMYFSEMEEADFGMEIPDHRGHRRSGRKEKALRLARSRFAQHEDERWLRRQIADWADYDADDDYSDLDFYKATFSDDE